MDEPPVELALRNLIHAERLVHKLLLARGCDDPDAVIADAIWQRAAERLCDLERVSLAELIETAANDATGTPRFGEDLCDWERPMPTWLVVTLVAVLTGALGAFAAIAAFAAGARLADALYEAFRKGRI